MQLHKLIASIAGIGFIKGGGTLASILYCIIWYLLPAGFSNSLWQLTSTLIIIIIGIWTANNVEACWGKDSSKVVIDEFAGMAITLLFIPHSIALLVAGLILFRFFDIVKPLGIRRMEMLPKGWGVMADDLLSGIYALIILTFVAYFKLLY